ncbi:hypothetical protein NGRA_3131 [Nosema granulosis]|uniref:Uncharacterized protein n=1 Tax=Nosema granulosis TaxID=83296 RepID=A0A9P6KXZ1_9MICR|nr:hypothetical protein NGRA_3131 [Nosema granulosis]
MANEGRKIIEDEELIFEIRLLGLKRYKEEIELLAMHFQEISEDFFRKSKEIIKKDAWKRRQDSKLALNQNKFKERSSIPQKTVNNVEDIIDVIKENYVYLYNSKLRLLIDIGSYYSFITTKVLEKIKDKPKKLKTPIKLYTCLLEEFFVEEEIELEFIMGGKIYSHKFYVLSRRNDHIIILGRTWIENRN